MSLSLLDFLLTLSEATDLVGYAETPIAHHGKQVAYISMRLATTLGLSDKQKENLLNAAIVHDIGVSSSHRFQSLSRWDGEDKKHALDGSNLLSAFKPFETVSKIVLGHHEPWVKIKDAEYGLLSNIIYLSDRVAISAATDTFILKQREQIQQLIGTGCGTVFSPEIVTAFEKLSKEEAFWFDIVSRRIDQILLRQRTWEDVKIAQTEIEAVALIFAKVIDTKSPFTAEHSLGVANVAVGMAGYVGFSKAEVDQMVIAGLLHDIGKLGIPDTILEKPGPLDDEERLIMKQHTYHTKNILDRINGFDELSKWAAYHHEHLDGSGYPFRLSGDDLSQGARIMAVADIFQALNQNRPYRRALQKPVIEKIMRYEEKVKAIDGDLVDVLLSNYDRFYELATSAKHYWELLSAV